MEEIYSSLLVCKIIIKASTTLIFWCLTYCTLSKFTNTSTTKEYLSAEIKRRGTFSKNDSFTKPNISASKSADSAVSANDPCPDQVIDTGIKPFTLKMPGE